MISVALSSLEYAPAFVGGADSFPEEQLVIESRRKEVQSVNHDNERFKLVPLQNKLCHISHLWWKKVQ